MRNQKYQNEVAESRLNYSRGLRLREGGMEGRPGRRDRIASSAALLPPPPPPCSRVRADE